MIPPPKCDTVWTDVLRGEHIHRCIRDEGHDGRHLCRDGDRLDPQTVITPEELDPAVRAGYRQKIAEHLDYLRTFRRKR